MGKPHAGPSLCVHCTTKMTGFKCFLVLAAVCLASQVSCGKAPRGAEGTGDSVQLDDVIARGKDTINNVTSQVSALLGLDNLPDSDNVAKALTNGTQVLSNTIQEVIGNIQKEVQNSGGSLTGLLEAMSARLTETVTALSAPSDGTKKGAAEIQQQITAGMNTVMEEAGKLAKALGGEASTVQEDLAKFARNTVQEVVTIGKSIEEKVQHAVDENKAAAYA